MNQFARLLFYAFFCLLLTYCSRKPVTVTENYTDIKAFVTGGHGITFNNRTGGVNDIAYNPVSHRPAVAYQDMSQVVSGGTPGGALKYAYMTGTGTWKVEVVDANYGSAACGTANGFCLGAPNILAGGNLSLLKLAFKSDGTPAIAYAFGQSAAGAGTKQIRYAERRGDANWRIEIANSHSTTANAANVATANTVDPLKGVSLVFDSSNNAHVFYAMYAQTAINNSLMRYAFRNSVGNWTNSSISTIVTAGTIAALGQGTNQSGATICPANDRPIVTYQNTSAAGGSGQLMYATCTASNSVTGCTAWTATNMFTGCGGNSCFSAGLTNGTNGGQRSDVAINPANNKPYLAIYSIAAPANSLYTAEAPNACDVAQPTGASSWGAPALIGGASQGLHGVRLAGSASAMYIAYYNLTTNTMLNINTGSGWNATGHIVETTTVAGQGLGLAYDPTSDVLYTSYAALPGAAIGVIGNDLKVSQVYPSEIVNAGVAGTLNTSFIDNLWGAFPATTTVPLLHSAKAPDGTYGLTYFFIDTSATNAQWRLWYGFRSANKLSPAFGFNFVTNHQQGAAASQYVGSYPALAYDADSNPVIAFHNGVTADQSLNVALSSDKGSSFSVTVVDEGSTAMGQFPSVDTYAGAVGVSYYDSTNTGLRFAWYRPGYGWRRSVVDGFDAPGSCGNHSNDAGRYSRVRFTSDGRPVIVYQYDQLSVKLAYSTEALDSPVRSWTCVNVENSATQRGEGIDFQLLEDKPHVAHFDATLGQVRYAKCADTVVNCTNGTAGYTAETADGSGITTTIITKPSISVTPAGKVYISYYNATQQTLGLASKSPTDTEWFLENLDPNTSGTSFASTAGQYGSMVLNEDNYPLIFYRSHENWIKYFARQAQ